MSDQGEDLGQRWLASAAAGGDQLAFEQGRRDANRGRVEGLTVDAGVVRGRVAEGRARALRAELSIPLLSDEQWDRLVEAIAGELRRTAAMLDGRLPDDLEAASREAEAPLLPTASQVHASCNCGRAAWPCRHVAALHHAVADMLDDDPFSLLELRGRPRESVLGALRARRAPGGSIQVPGTVSLDALGGVGLEAGAGDLTSISLQPRPVEDPAWLFSQLGDPPGVDDSRVLEAEVAAAAAFAWRLAAGEGAGAADEELLLSELRGQRMATASSVASALGWDQEPTREALDRLFDEGRVLRTGQDDRARYRAAADR